MPVRVATLLACVAVLIALMSLSSSNRAIAQVAADVVTADQVRTAIDTLGSLDRARGVEQKRACFFQGNRLADGSYCRHCVASGYMCYPASAGPISSTP